METNNLIELGHCRKPHGIKGAFTLSLFNREDSILKNGSLVSIFPLSKESEVPEEGMNQEIKTISFGNKVICEFTSVKDRNFLETLIPFSVFYPRENFPSLDDGEIYLNDLIGMDVFNEAGDSIGSVDSLSSNGVQDILHIKGNQELDVLFIDKFIISIDLKERSIIINVPELI